MSILDSDFIFCVNGRTDHAPAMRRRSAETVSPRTGRTP
ncbi:hypothetical protein BURMUCGD2_6741 [Burkholderia multivorans CGD2]|uniref:Uncharacterized protein n=1 Tax=Burkholderia multivorans CGD2 TaxID=513052 RepID=B9C0V0_9BURK|nr:hypothetical protein BURMUCGD2_6741 [Burkholderia multivorans CGD2]